MPKIPSDDLQTNQSETRLRLKNVESHLNMLLQDLSEIQIDSPHESVSAATKWDAELEGFRSRATTIRKIMERFYKADRQTRCFLRDHIDEEWNDLKTSYDSLRSRFTARE